MAKSPLAAAVAAQIKTQKLSKAAAAKAIGVGAPGLAALLAGKSRPNGATMPKYAKFLGISVEEVAKLAGRSPEAAAKGKGKARKTKARPARAAKGGGRAGGISLDEAVALAGDALAIAVHRADSTTRELLARLIK